LAGHRTSYEATSAEVKGDYKKKAGEGKVRVADHTVECCWRREGAEFRLIDSQGEVRNSRQRGVEKEDDLGCKRLERIGGGEGGGSSWHGLSRRRWDDKPWKSKREAGWQHFREKGVHLSRLDAVKTAWRLKLRPQVNEKRQGTKGTSEKKGTICKGRRACEVADKKDVKRNWVVGERINKACTGNGGSVARKAV